MTELAKKSMLLIMSEKCYDNYFEDFNFFDGRSKKIIFKFHH